MLIKKTNLLFYISRYFPFLILFLKLGLNATTDQGVFFVT